MTSIMNGITLAFLSAMAVINLIEGNHEKAQTFILFAIFVVLCEGFGRIPRKKEESE